MEALQQLERRLDQGRCKGRYTRDTAVWFLRDRRLDVAEAAGKLEAMLDWRARIGADGLDWASVAKEAASGKVYLHPHRDVLGRPVVVIHVRKHVMGASPGADSQRLCAWILDAALAALPPGQECVLGIFDLKGFSLQNADLGFARFLVDALFTYYPRRLGQAVLVDPPWAFQPGWSVVKPWLGKYGDLPALQACAELGIGLTMVKRLSRKYGIMRWPYRKNRAERRVAGWDEQHDMANSSDLDVTVGLSGVSLPSLEAMPSSTPGSGAVPAPVAQEPRAQGELVDRRWASSDSSHVNYHAVAAAARPRPAPFGSRRSAFSALSL
ncbi:hypothetical protein APUTEX25_004709 [Auxenochlorella protothecoides]|uniref:CRAL-TRIO domain-containing protein n=1 Tax=Auxenochlorella protothecoides TaxID=3075 RepID=A0A3M7L484_AUXPR|nr:hypothetical protein APUTEX25_004709 [Auxenochlorella protothecoides]|eukprot:RMZ56352.1 hypothetical protein APUTEX25_004709 [Auxenochlorella protothecoides]